MTSTYVKHTDPEDRLSMKLREIPIIVIATETYKKIKYFIDQCPTECQWYNLIEKGATASGRVVYKVSDFFIPEKVVGDKDVESDGNQMPPMWKEIKADRGITPTELSELIQKANFWGHSHVNMPTKPSSTDDKQWKEMCEGKAALTQPVGMIIFNKLGKYTNRISDPDFGGIPHQFENLDVYIEDPTDYGYIDAALTDKLKKRDPKPSLSPATLVTGGTSGKPGTGSSAGTGTTTTTDATKSEATTDVATGKKSYGGTSGTIEVVWGPSKEVTTSDPKALGSSEVTERRILFETLKVNVKKPVEPFNKVCRDLELLVPDDVKDADIDEVTEVLRSLNQSKELSHTQTLVEQLVEKTGNAMSIPKSNAVRAVAATCLLHDQIFTAIRKKGVKDKVITGLIDTLNTFHGKSESIVEYFTGEQIWPGGAGIVFIYAAQALLDKSGTAKDKYKLLFHLYTILELIEEDSAGI